jgi:predicted nucleic acid-binding Zn ribbon protein
VSPPHDGPGSRGGQPTRIGDLISPALERLGPKGLWIESKVRKLWPSVVGVEVAANAHVARLRGKVLEVDVASDAWATELTYLGQTIVDRLNASLGPGTVERVTVRRKKKR